MKIAAWQAPLLASGSMEAITLMRRRIDWCEAHGVTILCAPEAILGGLADHAASPASIAIRAENGELDAVLAPLASDAVTTIIGFTEITASGELFNAAAVVHRGAVTGIYRKLHPAIRKSVYTPGSATPVFTVDGLTFGIVLCNDSNFPAPARAMAAQGASVLFVPSNNGLPPERADVVADARRADVALATANGMMVVRADTAGRADGRVSHGSSGIVAADGRVLQAARLFEEELLVAEANTRTRG